MQMFIWMNFSECLSNSNKHLLAVKAFYARCLNSADTPASLATCSLERWSWERILSKFYILNSKSSLKPGTNPRAPSPPIAWSPSAACGVSVGGEVARNPFIKVNLEAARAASQILVFITVTGLAGKLLLPSQNILELFLGFFVVLLFVLFF